MCYMMDKMRIYSIRRTVFIGLLFVVVLLLYISQASVKHWMRKETKALIELKYYMETMQEQCAGYHDNHTNKLNSNPKLMKHFHRPKCLNLLETISKGKWVPADEYNYDLERELNEIHLKFRQKVGISPQPWRPDGKCGYQVLYDKISNEWPQTGTFCDPTGPIPCCTNFNKGTCVPATQCDCPTCVDTSKYKDALLSKWTTDDHTCDWKKYTALEACEVLNRLSSPNKTAHLYFVGDSLMRNMFMGLASILTGNTKRGIYRKCVSKELHDICSGDNLFVFRPCHDLTVAYSLENLNRNAGELCDGHRNIKAEYVGYGMPSQSEDFMNFVNSLKGKENSYIILGVGLHFGCKDVDVVNQFLHPAFTSIKQNGLNWPRFLWVHPNSVGLLKPPGYMSTQGDEAIGKFAANMEHYLKQYNVPVLDFRQITKGVNSYDGTHYGSGVNMMKVQILLNYFAAST